MVQPENKYIQSIHRKLLPLKKTPLYYVKLQVSGNNGIPDCYYSGQRGDLWIEYKYVGKAAFPLREASLIDVALSANQRRWLNERHAEGRNVAVILGSPYGGIILRFPFPEKISVADFISNAMDIAGITGYIKAETLKYPNERFKNGNSTHYPERPRQRAPAAGDMGQQEGQSAVDPDQGGQGTGAEPPKHRFPVSQLRHCAEHHDGTQVRAYPRCRSGPD